MGITDDRVETHEEARAALVRDLRALLSSNDARRGTRRIVRLQRNAPRLDPLVWLYNQSGPAKLYWSDREGAFSVAGLGETTVQDAASPLSIEELFTRMRADLSSDYRDLRYYGGMRFDPNAAPDEKWESLGAYRFVIPECELGQESHQDYLACNVLLPDTAADEKASEALVARVESLNFSSEGPLARVGEVLSRTDAPDRASWRRSVNELLRAFESNGVKKVVLARESKFTLSGPQDPLAVLSTLKDNTTYSYHFAIQAGPGKAFVGASPERLYRRTSTYLQSEALAGTRPRGATPEDDAQLGKELRASEKEVQEHRFVLEAIEELFKEHCQAIQGGDKVELLPLRHCQHLLTRIEGMLTRPDCDAALLEGLHPTPAVGGTPRKAALERIAATEPFDRGWYTGPVGWVGYDGAEFAVAIRSALVDGDTVTAYTGAGIVAGSEAEEEWEELESKLADFRSLLEDPSARRETVQP